MKIKNLTWILIIILLASFTLAADDFEVKYRMLNDNIDEGETALAQLTILNYQNYADDFTISSPDVDTLKWEVVTDPLSDYILTVRAHDTNVTKLKLKPLEPFESAFKLVRVRIQSRNTKTLTELVIPVKRAAQDSPILQYVPSVKASAEMPDEIDPRDQLPIKVTISNRNWRNLSGLVLRMEGSLFAEETTLDLGPMGEVTKEFLVNFDPMQVPIKDTVHFYVMFEKAYLTEIQKPIKILSYSDLDIKKEESSKFLITERKYIITNRGNINSLDPYKYKVSNVESWFTKTNPASTIVTEDNQKYVVFNLDLEPNKSTVLVVTTNYTPLVILVLTILLLIISYYMLRSPITVMKVASEIIKKEGGISKMKLMIHLKNRSRRTVNNLTIIERIPHIASLIKESIIGSLQPYKIAEFDKRGTIIKWNLPNLEPYEERIITYRIASRLTIIGGIKLPATIVKYKQGERERITNSKKLNILA
ncbi:hypothetical protein K9M79_01415 [Candidatus Woesearchaeota archaeon]|nr:hypothetical protein [Candidatus Woesearchaeota archaeon]